MKFFLLYRNVVAIMIVSLLVIAPFANTQTLQDNLWVTNGPVYSTVRSGNTIYIGGEFTRVGPATGSCVLLNSTTGTQNTDFPRIDGNINAIVSDGSGGWFIGGSFSMIGTTAKKNLAHILSDNTVDPSWNPEPNSSVTTLALSGSYLYVGGYFTVIGGQSRTKLAQLDITSGLATSWNPNPNSSILCLTLNGAGTVLFVGGSFSSISGNTRKGIAAYSIPTMILNATFNTTATSYCNISTIALSVTGDTVYVGGYFPNIGGQARNNVASLFYSNGTATSWNPNASGGVNALLINGSKVYIGGSFTSCGSSTRPYLAYISLSNNSYYCPEPYGMVSALVKSEGKVYVGGDFQSLSGDSRGCIGTFDINNGQVLSWSPNLNSYVTSIAISGTNVCVGGYSFSMGSVRRNNIVALDATSGQATDWNPEVNGVVKCLSLSGSLLYVGGDFSVVGGKVRNSLASINISTGSVSDWNPNANSEITSIVVSENTVYASGYFTTIGGVSRKYLAGIDATTGIPTALNATFDGEVLALAISGTTLYAGGYFSTVNTSNTRMFLCAFDLTTGILKSWNPNADGGVSALTVSGPTVYAAGDFYTMGGQVRQFICGIDGSTGDPTPWNPSASDPVRSIAISGNNLYVGGEFGSIGGQTRWNLACIDMTTGSATSWNPNTYDLVPVYTVFPYGQTVYVGGEFVNMANSPHTFFAGVTDTSISFSGALSVKYRTFTADTLGYISYQKPSTRPKYPNTANVIYETYKRMPTAVLRVGAPGQVNLGLKEKAYVQPKTYTDVLKTFLKGTTNHTGTARGLDYDNKNALLLKKYLSLDPVKHNNTLLADLMALQVNIAASDTGVTPYGFADLVYDEGNGNPLSGMAMDEIAEYANEVMTNYEFQPYSVFENIDTTVRKINEAFFGPFDTTAWIVGSKLRVKGTQELGKVSFLRTSTVTRSRIIPTASYEDILPSTYSLRQNYPNPFNPTTTIQFELGQNSLVTLKIYNMLGQEVATVLDRDEMYEGEREVTFNGKELASGVYFYRLVAEKLENEDETGSEPFVQVKKMVLVK